MKSKMFLQFLPFILLTLLIPLLFGCGDSGEPGSPGGDRGTSSIIISWNDNHETLVNDSGGGYRVYYSGSPGFSLNNSGVFMNEVPYVSGSQSPTSTTLILENGTWYIKVVAFMDLNGESVSLPSAETSINLP